MSASALTSLASRLRGVATLGAKIAAEVAPDLLALNKASAAAGMTSDGKPWAPKKAGGGRALVRAADALSVSVVGDLIVLALKGVNVFHNTKRPIIVDTGAGVPKAYASAIHKAAQRVAAGAVT